MKHNPSCFSPPTRMIGDQRTGSVGPPLFSPVCMADIPSRHTDTFSSFFSYFLLPQLLMDISRMKKLFAGVSVAAISLTQMGTALAAYSDVPAGVWYEEAVDAFTDAGYLDASQTRFRGGDSANRAEFTKLVVELNGGILSTAPAVPSFDDVAPGAWYYGYMEEAAKEGWVKGDSNCYGSHPCNARPGANINRAEAGALIVRAFGLESTGDAPSFVDVPNGQWYTDAVQTAADHCVLQGDDATGRARPADFMNRAEMVVMLHRVDMGLTYGVDCSTGTVTEPMIRDVTSTSADTVEVEFTVDLDEDAATDPSRYSVSGDDNIDVESVEMIDDQTVELTLEDTTVAGDNYTLSVEDMETADGETFSDSMSFSGYSEIEQGDGILEVSLASTNPSADTVPQGAVGVVMVSVDLSASCDDDVVISEMTVLHEGFGPSSDISGLYAAIDGARMTRKRSIDSQDQTADIRFTDPLMVDACDTVTVDLVADFNTSLTAGSEHNLAVELPSDFQSNAMDVDGNFPLRGNTFRIASVTSGVLDFEYRTISPDTTEVGNTNQVVGKFQIDVNSVEDQTVYALTLEQNGTASDGDVTNMRIQRTDGTVLTNTVSSTTSDYATFIFDPPFTILEGDSMTLEVVGDIAGGAGETVTLQLEESSDLFAVGSLYGYGVNGQLYGSRVTTTGTVDTVTIDAGQLTIELDGPSQQTYTPDDDDAVLANVNISTGDEPVDIQDLFVAIRGQTSTGAAFGDQSIVTVLEDVELRNTRTGRTISATTLSGGDTSGTADDGAGEYQIYRFDDFIVDGMEEWELRVDFIENSASHPSSGDRFRAEVCTSPTSCDFGGLLSAVSTSYKVAAEGLSTGDTVTDVRPGTSLTGNQQLIATPEFIVAVRDIGATDTAVKNTKNVNLLRFEARAGEAKDVLITGAAFESASGSLLNGQNYALWVDTDGDSIVDTILEDGVAAGAGVTGTVSFNDLAGGGYVVPAEETVLFEVHADIASSLVNNDLKIEFADTNAASSRIEAEEVDNGSALSIGTEITIDTTFASKLYTLVTSGDLFVTKDSESVRSRQILGGTLGDSVLRLNFRAQNEDIDVTQIQIATTGSLVGANSIDRLELYKAGETSAFATATIGNCGSDTKIGLVVDAEQTFCANMQSQQLVVQSGQDIDVVVRPRAKTDQNGARSSSGVTFWTGSGAAGTAAFGIEARGRNSSSELVATDADGTAEGEITIGGNTVSASSAAISGNSNMVVLAKITSITNASPDADGSNVPTGVRPIGQFTFTAATNSNTLNGTNTATLSGIILNVSSTSVTMDDSEFRFYNKADASQKSTCTTSASGDTASGSFTVRCDGLVAATVNSEIDSGSSVTFVLETSVLTATSSATLQVSLQDFTDIDDADFGTAANNNHIHWLDQDTTSTSFFWIEYADTVVNSTSYSN